MRSSRLVLTLALLAGAVIVPGSVAPPPAEAQAGPRYYSDFTYERVFVPMRDDVELAVDIWRPVTPKGVKVPVILQLTPYHVLYKALDTNEENLPSGDAALFVPKGYAYALADVRGTYNSGGCWDYGGKNERQDGYDLVEWLGTQGWSNGKVAMTGASYDGTTANAAAVENPPHLATIVPISAISRWYGYSYQQGVRATTSGEGVDIDPPGVTPPDFMFGYGFLPPPDPAVLTQAQQVAMRWNLCDRVEIMMKAYSSQPDYDAFWKERDYLRRAHKVKVPVLVAHGQLDFNVKTWEGTAWYEALPGEKALVLGQWPHASPRSRYPEWDVFLEKWYERWLYGVRNGVENEPAVRVQTNDREWRLEETWGKTKRHRVPLEGGEFSYLDDGLLTESEMTRGIGSGRYVRVPLEATSNIRFQGTPVLRLRAKSDKPTGHLVAVLCESSSSGGCTVVSRAFMNLRYRDGLAKGKDLEPGKFYNFDLEFIDKDHVVDGDSHLEVIIASSSSTWVAPNEERANMVVDLDRSYLDLPLLR
ncbi:MAG: CocE/NonD family hydrolase [Actinomycetota bacterium]